MPNALIHIVLIKIIGRRYYFTGERIGSEKLCNKPKDKHLVTGSRNSNSLYSPSYSSFPNSVFQYRCLHFPMADQQVLTIHTAEDNNF